MYVHYTETGTHLDIHPRIDIHAQRPRNRDAGELAISYDPYRCGARKMVSTLSLQSKLSGAWGQRNAKGCFHTSMQLVPRLDTTIWDTHFDCSI